MSSEVQDWEIDDFVVFYYRKGITTVYLTTHDQQAFYQKLGYCLCEPIVVFGGMSQSLTQVI
jgi:hypothetical protein